MRKRVARRTFLDFGEGCEIGMGFSEGLNEKWIRVSMGIVDC